jgi:predicted O-linked N-acetylglucosamine transferase (SPINDLY family)
MREQTQADAYVSQGNALRALGKLDEAAECYRHALRLSHLSTAGLAETIAGNFDQYVRVATGLAANLPRLGQLRAGLRERVAHSPLCDQQQFANNLMRILRDVWRQWC